MSLQWRLYFNNDTAFVSIQAAPFEEPTIEITGTVDAEIHAAVHYVLEVARRLSKGQSIEHYLDPVKKPVGEVKILKCKWMKSGKLWCFGETTKRFHHSETVEEAVSQRRVFTCPETIFVSIPKVRGKR